MSNVPNNVNIHEDTPNNVIVNQDAPNQVVVRLGGGTGATTATRRHVHTQGTASTTWTITHQLGGRPQVTIVDSADTVVVGEVTYNSNSEVEVNFTSAFSGFAYLT
jgi:hypothetical protein